MKDRVMTHVTLIAVAMTIATFLLFLLTSGNFSESHGTVANSKVSGLKQPAHFLMGHPEETPLLRHPTGPTILPGIHRGTEDGDGRAAEDDGEEEE